MSVLYSSVQLRDKCCFLDHLVAAQENGLCPLWNRCLVRK